MKKNISQKFTLLILLLLLISSSSNAQLDFKRHKGGSLWRHWFVKANIGVNAYFGDLSTYDHDPFNKLKHESKFGYSASVGKWINDWGGANFTFSGGKLTGIRHNYQTHTDFYQYTIEGLVNITQLFNDHDQQSIFYVFAKVGFGLIDFNAHYTNINTGDTINMVGKHTPYDKRVTEWVVPLSIGGVYNIDKNFALFFDATYNYVNSDKLDAKYDGSGDGDKDYFVYVSAGVKYTFTVKDTHGKYRRSSSRRKMHWTR